MTSAATTDTATTKVERALAFIDAHLGAGLTLPRIARALEVSPHHFAHLFKRTTGVAPHRYVMQRRVEKAKELLLATDLPIAAIAYDVGCASQSHFCALFHRATGVTPQVYRKLLIYGPAAPR
jgi:AraC family transcriptional regulator